MDIGDKVQHFSTGSIGTIIDTSYEIGTPLQQMCVQWEDDKSSYKDSWERRDDLSAVPEAVYNFLITD